uniref:Tetratricopeptide repeat protein n=1 Tax=Leptospirillum ferriphilum TaxID=178606 RepID=A0A7C3LQV1_9BACT
MTPEEIVALEERLEGNPKSRSFLQLAEAYLESGAVEKALPLLNQGVEYYPYYLAARITLGQLQKNQGMLDDAIKNFEFVTRTIPDNLVAQKNLADLYFRKEEKEKALESLKMALSLSPGDPELIELEKRINGKSESPSSSESSKSPSPPPFPDVPASADPSENSAETLAFSSEESPAMEIPPSAAAHALEEPLAVPDSTENEPLLEQEKREESMIEESPLDSLENEPPPDDDELLRLIPQTETMGDLFMSQKRYPQAEKIYEGLLSGDPGNERLVQKLELARKRLPLDSETLLSPSQKTETPGEARAPELSGFSVTPTSVQTEEPAAPLDSWQETNKAAASSAGTIRNADVSTEDDKLLDRLKDKLFRDLIGVIVASENGLVLTEPSGDENSEILAAEGIELLRQLDELALALGQGAPLDGFVWLEKSILYFVNRPSNGGIFLWLNPQANIGRCRLIIRQELGLSPGDGKFR